MHCTIMSACRSDKVFILKPSSDYRDCSKESATKKLGQEMMRKASLEPPVGDKTTGAFAIAISSKLMNLKQCVKTILHHSYVSSSPSSQTSSSSAPLIRSTSFQRQTKLLAPIMVSVASALVVMTLISASTLLDIVQATTTNQKPISELNEVQQGEALNYLLFTSARRQQLQQQQHRNFKLEELLKDTNHSHISDRVNIQLANSIWKQMHQNALEFAQKRSRLVRPTIDRFLEQSNVSLTCRRSLNDIIDHLEQLDDWAVRMYNSFGDFPANGFFEGTHTSMGDYHQCVNLGANQVIGKPQYCTFKFQPIIPRRPRYHNILATIENLANFTSQDDMFHGLAKKAHYFYYTKLRLATCMPSKCEKSDLEQLGEQIAVNTYLQFQGVTCLKKRQGFKPDGAQIFALIVLISLASVSMLGTLVHLLNLKTWLLSYDKMVGGGKLHNERLNCNNNQVVSRQQILLAPSQKEPMLPTQVIQVTTTTSTDTVPTLVGKKASSRSKDRLVQIFDILIHFSVVKNAKKLFDTSTSRRGNNIRVSSLMPRSNEEMVMVENELACNGTNDGVCGSSTGSNTSSSSTATSNCTSNSRSSTKTTTTTAATDHQSDSSSVDVVVEEEDNQTQTNDISCVHGLRFWTISWIILGHTMQYTEWAGFGRAYQVEENITSFLLHPLLNATFSVDTFFLISGLLTTYVTWTITRGQYWRFNKFAFLISRYLRLTPQVLLVLLIFIVFPLMGDGPYWEGLIQKESDYCKQNWWVSALYLQSFYRSDQICNLVTWWLSIEMFYHFVSIIVIIALLRSARQGTIAALLVGGGMTLYSCYLHYVNHYPPNMLPTLLQRYEIWDSIVLKYFWTPYPHAPSYFTGLLLGYALYNRSVKQLSKKQVRLGWLSFTICYLMILFGTYHWNNNAPYSRLVATIYYNLSQVFWSLATGWAILACAIGHGGWLNGFLSSPVFVPLGRATYMTYLSHMIIVRAYPAKMNLLIEPSYIVFLYIFIANLFLSYALGIFLTLVYESPILHLQKLLVSRMALKFNEDKNPKTIKNNSEGQKVVRVALYSPQQQISTNQDRQVMKEIIVE